MMMNSPEPAGVRKGARLISVTVLGMQTALKIRIGLPTTREIAVIEVIDGEGVIIEEEWTETEEEEEEEEEAADMEADMEADAKKVILSFEGLVLHEEEEDRALVFPNQIWNDSFERDSRMSTKTRSIYPFLNQKEVILHQSPTLSSPTWGWSQGSFPLCFSPFPPLLPYFPLFGSLIVFETRLLQILNAKGFKVPTPIQAEAIPTLLGGKDFIGQAHTGFFLLFPFVGVELLSSC
jgi:hypothetical protein